MVSLVSITSHLRQDLQLLLWLREANHHEFDHMRCRALSVEVEAGTTGEKAGVGILSEAHSLKEQNHIVSRGKRLDV